MEPNDLAAMRRVIQSLPPDQLEALGVKLKTPPPSEWVWLRDLMADALENLGRDRASKSLRGTTFTTQISQYPVGITAELLAEMGRLIAHKFVSEKQP